MVSSAGVGAQEVWTQDDGNQNNDRHREDRAQEPECARHGLAEILPRDQPSLSLSHRTRVIQNHYSRWGPQDDAPKPRNGPGLYGIAIGPSIRCIVACAAYLPTK